MYKAAIPFIVILFSFFFWSCDLFKPADPYYLDNIREEIAWANAAKLTVSVTFPNEWGTSPQAGTNKCFDSVRAKENPRQGYVFEVEFTPNTEYSLIEWRAYRTSELDELEGWLTDLGILEDLDNFAESGDVTVANLTGRGGKADFIINTTEPLTLVPWCEALPYVLRTVPRGGRTIERARNILKTTAIDIVFNTALDSRPLKIGEGMVEITARHVDSDGDFDVPTDGWYDSLSFGSSGGQYVLSIHPSFAGPPIDHLIKVKIGDNIYNDDDDNKAKMQAPETFYYLIAERDDVDVEISGWSAGYNNGTVNVACTVDGDIEEDEAEITAYYRVNQGPSIGLMLARQGETDTFTGTISAAGGLDVSGVADGRSVSGIQEYQIFIELNALGEIADMKTFRIWNLPEMSVSDSNPLIEISTQADLDAVSEKLDGQFVLMNDITVNSHTPIGAFVPVSDDESHLPDPAYTFSGKFYGNGHTVSINSFAGEGSGFADIGLFGVAGKDAVVRDLTVAYNNVSLNAAESRERYGYENIKVDKVYNIIQLGFSASSFGGIAGYAYEGSFFENVLSKGEVNIGGSAARYAGGIAGDIMGGTVQNAHSDIKFSMIDGDITLGGIAGYIEKANLNKCVFAGEITVTSTGSVISGGIIGFNNIYVEKSIITDCLVKNVNIEINAAKIIAGGVFGQSTLVGDNTDDHEGSTTISNTYFDGGTITIVSLEEDPFKVQAGGFCGSLYPSDSISNSGVMSGSLKADIGGAVLGGFCGDNANGIKVSNGFSRMDIMVKCTNDLYVGGFAGRTWGGNTFSKCYAAGNVTAIQSGENSKLYIGGFAGSIGSSSSIEDCYALGDVFAEKTGRVTNINWGNDVFGGGIAGLTDGTITRCYSMGKVIIQSKYSKAFAGGIAGTFQFLSSIRATAALGDFVYAGGFQSTDAYCGRIIPDYYPSGIEYNYANGQMFIGKMNFMNYINGLFNMDTDGFITGFNVDQIIFPPVPYDPNAYYNVTQAWTYFHDGPNGSVGANFKSRQFWRGEEDANFKFDNDYWLFTTVESIGRPILRGADVNYMLGPPLPGQM